MLPTLLLTQLFSALCVRSLGILIPLDVGPGSGGCSGWEQVISSISANPQTPFFSIVNPNDGPGDHGSQPNIAFQQCVQSLRPRANAIVLGYINTGGKSSSNIQAEVDTYAEWNSSYRPTGILFDGVSSASSLFNQYKNYTTYARGKGFKFIGLDPGDMPDSLYFSIADLVNVYESPYASFDASEHISDGPSAPISKQSVWLTGAPNTGSYSSVISQISKTGVAAAYISNLRDDEAGIPTQWSLFVEDVSKVNAGLDNSTITETSPTMDTNLPKPSGGGTGNTEVPPSPQTTEEGLPLGPIIGGSLGGLFTLMILLFIVFLIRRNHQRKDRRAVHPFTDSLPTPPESTRPVPGEKLRFTQVLGFRARVSPKQGMVSITASSESRSAPSSSAVVGLLGSQAGIATHSPLLEEPPATRRVSIGPPPNYSP